MTLSVHQQRDQLEKLAGMEARERSQLAESIHDEPIQRIVAGMMRLENLCPRLDREAQAELELVSIQLEMAAAWLRELVVVALSPPILTDGIGAALDSLAHSIFAGTVTVYSSSGPLHAQLAPPAKEAAYRILREALINARKHAKATTVRLLLAERNGNVVLSLVDDGVGSDTLDAGRGHFGVATMRARADAEGGHLGIESTPGVGTVVTLTLPMMTKTL